MKISFIPILVLSVAALNSSCATMIHGTDDMITVNSVVSGTTIYVDGVARGQDQIALQVERGKRHVITASKPGYQTITMKTGRRFDFTTLLGVFIDYGIFSIPIDFISGAAWRTHPTSYTLNPVPLPPSSGPMTHRGTEVWTGNP